MIEFIKKNKKIIISSSIFTGINSNMYCGCKDISGKDSENTPKISDDNPYKPAINNPIYTPRSEEEEDKDKDKGKEEDKDKGKEEDKDKGKEEDKDKGKEEDKDKGKEEDKDKGKEEDKDKENATKSKTKTLEIFSDDFLQNLDEKYFTSKYTHDRIKEYIAEGLKLKKKDEEINNLKKILAECKKNEEKIIEEINKYYKITEFEKKNDSMIKKLYFIKEYEISNININLENLFDDKDNLYYIYKKYAIDYSNEINDLKNKYEKEPDFKKKFDETIEKAKNDYNKIGDVIDKDDVIEKIYITNVKSEKGKTIIEPGNILKSYKNDQGSKFQYKNLFDRLLGECIHQCNLEIIGVSIKFKKNSKLIIEKYEDINEDVRKEIESKGLTDKVKGYIKLFVSINENIEKLDDDTISVKDLYSKKDRINERMNSLKETINNIII